MKKTPPTKLNIQDKLLSQDRWIAFCIFLALIAAFFCVLEIKKIDAEYEQKMLEIQQEELAETAINKENLSVNSGFDHHY